MMSDTIVKQCPFRDDLCLRFKCILWDGERNCCVVWGIYHAVNIRG